MEALKRIVIKEELVVLTGDYRKAIILNQFLYWTERVKDFDKFIIEEKLRFEKDGEESNYQFQKGWIYKTSEELSEETMLGLSKSNIRLHIKSLIERGWIDERVNPNFKWDKTMQYRVNMLKLQEDLYKLGYALEGYPLFFDGVPVINNITDTVGRTVAISYQTTADGKEITITAPDTSTIKYVLEPIQGCTGEYRLTKKIDRLNRETKFIYDIDSGQFTFFTKNGRDKENKYANLTEIHYPTGAYSEYTYEKTVGNMGNKGSKEYFRIKTRQDIESGKSYNKKTYDYSGNYTGYPTYNNPNSLPSDFTYGV